MKRISNKQIAEVFRQAKDYLWNGHTFQRNKQQYICHAIDFTGCSILAKEKACSIIENRLGNGRTVVGWLEDNVPSFPDNTTEYQKYRHAWLDELIKELS